MTEKIANKVVLAYSGGLDTSVAVRWLLEHKCNEVICVAIDLGQGDELEPIQAKALKIGASASEVVDARQEFADDYCFQALKANAKYDGEYPLSTSVARPLIAKKLVEIAKKYKADAIAHGCTAKGNDQVRFDVSIMALAPDIKIIAPAREWNMTRDESIDYAQKHGIEVPIKKENPFSIDLNLWGRSCECGVIEDATQEAPANAYELTVDPKDAPDEATYIKIKFEKGIPVALASAKTLEECSKNLQNKPSLELIDELNKITGANAVGRIDQIENRVVGIKSREIYECPAAVVLNQAHEDLEILTMTREMKHFKSLVDQKYSQLIYDGRWFNPLREALDAFLDKSQEKVSGVIGLKLYKGSAKIVSRESENSLYDSGLATYDKGDTFNHDAAVGFIELFGLDLKTYNL